MRVGFCLYERYYIVLNHTKARANASKIFGPCPYIRSVPTSIPFFSSQHYSIAIVSPKFTLIMTSNTVDLSSTAGLGSEEFDFVIVGGGLSGLVVASRLTENEKVRVLVLEAGADRREDLRISCQGLVLSTYFNPDFDWCMSTEPQVSNFQFMTLWGNGS